MQTGASTGSKAETRVCQLLRCSEGSHSSFAVPGTRRGHLEGTPVLKGSGDMWVYRVDTSPGGLGMGSCSLVLVVQLRELRNLDFQCSFGLHLAGLLPDPFLSSPSHLMFIPGLTPARMRSLFVPAALGNSHCLRCQELLSAEFMPPHSSRQESS